MFKISAIVPLGNDEKYPKDLIRVLKQNAIEVLVVAGPERSGPFLSSPKYGRAKQMNYAAQKASGDYLWFIHADTILNQNNIDSLFCKLSYYPEDLLYFNLKFYDGPYFMILNQIGLQFRSEVFHIPFGDQAFCISKNIFRELGGYDEDLSYGEDHVFTWKLRLSGRECLSVGDAVYTSARKYARRGWGHTTFLHLILTLKQAWPFWMKLIEKR